MTASKNFQHAVRLNERPLLTLAALDTAIEIYRATHNGRNPSAKSGEADDDFGYAIMWSTVNMRFVHAHEGLPAHGLAADLTREYGDDRSKWPKSLSAYCAIHYPDQPTLSGRQRAPALTVDALRKAIIAYRATHQGRNPNAFSGDATDYFGYRANWNSVNNSLSETAIRKARGLREEIQALFGDDQSRWPTNLTSFCQAVPQPRTPSAPPTP